jgi:methylmalonyl-CoA/ethylmalonyl-CoA epimerase
MNNGDESMVGCKFSVLRINIFIIIPAILLLIKCAGNPKAVPEHFGLVDQVLWIVKDLDHVIYHWKRLGFDQIIDLGEVDVTTKIGGGAFKIKLAKANLGGAQISWIQPLERQSLFSDFLLNYGEGGFSLIHRMPGKEEIAAEVDRLRRLGIEPLEEIEMMTRHGILYFVFMNTRSEGKYILGYTFGEADLRIQKNLLPDNRHSMKLVQYAFAVRDPEAISTFWEKVGLPAFQSSHPKLVDPHYYGQPSDYELIQGWQKHGTIDYEWCVPVKLPNVYEDHIQKHGEGIHHLAFSVTDMDSVLKNYASLGYSVSMGGMWGEKEKPGSGRYEYINLDNAGGVTMELLWNFQE